MRTATVILNELSDIDPTLGLIIARDRKQGISDTEILDRVRKAVDEETARRKREQQDALEDFNNMEEEVKQ